MFHSLRPCRPNSPYLLYWWVEKVWVRKAMCVSSPASFPLTWDGRSWSSFWDAQRELGETKPKLGSLHLLCRNLHLETLFERGKSLWVAKCWRTSIEAIGLRVHVRFKWILSFWVPTGEVWLNAATITMNCGIVSKYSVFTEQKVLIACVCREEFDGVNNRNQCQIAWAEHRLEIATWADLLPIVFLTPRVGMKGIRTCLQGFHRLLSYYTLLLSVCVVLSKSPKTTTGMAMKLC